MENLYTFHVLKKNVNFCCVHVLHNSNLKLFVALKVHILSCSADLLGLSFDDMVTVPTDKQQTQPQLEPTMPVMAPHISSDISLLEPTPSTTVPEVSEPKGSLALNLLETPLTSLKVPDEYSQLPPVAGWTNKVSCLDHDIIVM